MGILEKIAQAPTEIQKTRATEFVGLARLLLAARGRFSEAVDRARRGGAPDRSVEILERAASAGTLGGNFGALAPYKLLSESFISSLAPFSAFDAIALAGGFVAMPMLTRIAVMATAATGGTVGESVAKPVTSLALDSMQLEPRKVGAILVVSQELAELATAAGLTLIGNELRRAIGVASDSEFFGALAGTYSQSISSSGMSAAQFTSDLNDALHLLQLGATSKTFIVAPPNVVRAISLMRGRQRAGVPGRRNNRRSNFRHERARQ